MTSQRCCGALARLHWHSPDEQLLPIALSANVSVVVLRGSAAQAARHAAVVCDTEGHLVRALQRRHDALALHSITCRVTSVRASSDLSPPRVLCSPEASSSATTVHETLLDDMHCGRQDAAHCIATIHAGQHKYCSLRMVDTLHAQINAVGHCQRMSGVKPCREKSAPLSASASPTSAAC